MSSLAGKVEGYAQIWIDRVFTPIRQMEIEDDSLKLIQSDNKVLSFKLSNFDEFAKYKKGILASDFTLQVSGEEKVFKWLKGKDAKQFAQTLNKQVSEAVVIDIVTRTKTFFSQVYEQYPRDSWGPFIEKTINDFHLRAVNPSSILDKHLSQQDTNAMEAIAGLYPFNMDRLRSEHERHQLKIRQNFFQRVESNPLTHEQSLAVLRNNDLNMVLAAAGTGKTSVIVAKALDLVDRGLAKPEEVLVLAYNKAAAKEIKTRLAKRAETSGTVLIEQPAISTFHALGLSILKEAGFPTYMSEFTEDSLKLTQWVTKWMMDYIQAQSGRMIKFLSLFPEPTNPFDFKSTDDYEAYVRDGNLRTLAMEDVKGYQELLIANYLYVEGVPYKYEAPYVSQVRLKPGFNYRPDFYLTEANLYLEHFGISRDGKTRPDIDAAKYNEEIEKKRAVHEKFGTELLETFHYEWTEGTLLSGLDEKLKHHDVERTPKRPEDLLKELNETGKIAAWAKKFISCLEAIRAERLDETSLLKRLHVKKIAKAELWAEVLNDLVAAYKAELERQDRIDFDDMIIRATSAIQSAAILPRWKYILVDEFQDISEARMDLVRSLIRNSDAPSLTVVGDDWQSIYHFNGGKLELTTRFSSLVGEHTLTKLQKTFRYNNSIAHTAGAFVMQNPEQYKKEITTNDVEDLPQIYLLDDKVVSKIPALLKVKGSYQRAAQIAETIRKNDPGGSIAVIARYRFVLNEARRVMRLCGFKKNIEYWTYHGAKGLEADYVILVGLCKGRTGFPNTRKGEKVIEALLPSLDSFEHSEERRLMYVGLTRARRKVYIIGEALNASPFIHELMDPKFKVNIQTTAFDKAQNAKFKCPHCVEGYFRTVDGKHGPYYRCNTHPGCPIGKARTCEKCQSPSIDGRYSSVCNDRKCGHSFPICEKCGRPMIERKGSYGRFWGCSGFGLKEDRCMHKVNHLPNDNSP